MADGEYSFYETVNAVNKNIHVVVDSIYKQLLLNRKQFGDVRV